MSILVVFVGRIVRSSVALGACVRVAWCRREWVSMVAFVRGYQIRLVAMDRTFRRVT